MSEVLSMVKGGRVGARGDAPPPPPSLAERQQQATRRLILETAVDLLEGSAGVTELSVRAVAEAAGLSERTVFRHFANRELFLDAVAAAIGRRLEDPPAPTAVAELLTYPSRLFSCFEAHAPLVRATLHSEMFHRVRETLALERWRAIGRIVDTWAGTRPERERRLATANLRFLLGASTWHYYRFYFGFSLDDTIAAVERGLRLELEALGLPRPDDAPESLREYAPPE